MSSAWILPAEIVTNCDLGPGCGMVELVQVLAIVVALVLIAGWVMGGLNVQIPEVDDE